MRALWRMPVSRSIEVRPHGADDAEGHVDEEHEAPVDGRQHAAQDEPDERPREAGDDVDAERHAALVGGEGVGDDRRRVRHEHRAAHGLHHAEDDDVQRGRGPGAPGVSESATAASVKTTKPALYMRTRPNMSPRRPKRTTSTAVDQPVAHQHPEQVDEVAGVQGVEVDAAEDRRERDQEARGVDHRHHGCPASCWRGRSTCTPRVASVLPLVSRGGVRRPERRAHRLRARPRTGAAHQGGPGGGLRRRRREARCSDPLAFSSRRQPPAQNAS